MDDTLKTGIQAGIRVIRSLLGTIENALSGTDDATASRAQAQLQMLVTGLKTNDDAADALVKEKFPETASGEIEGK
jgi:hypothetical protein